jgi:acyl-CoA synthetase (AMP-forming)/AMP-acid ligase II/acyl carrier protein
MRDSFDKNLTLPLPRPALQDEACHSSRTFADLPTEGPDESIAKRLEKIARCHGGRPAFIIPGLHDFAYTEIFAQLTNTVRALNDFGIGRGDRVALVSGGGASMASAFLSLTAGAVCAPLDPRLKVTEFARLFRALQARALVIESRLDCAAGAAAEQLSIPIVQLITEQERPGRFTLQGSRRAPSGSCGFAQADETALVLFTSGTTAEPKLVPLTHRNLLASAGNIAASLKLTSDDRCLNIMPLFHIHGLIGGLLASLVSGGSVSCPTGFLATSFLEWFEKFQPTWYSAVPAMHQVILAEVRNYPERVRGRPLRFLRSASAPLPTSVMAELENVFCAPVIEAYGMTEAAHQIASNPLPPQRRKAGSVGRPTGTQVAIMNDGGDFVAPGNIGEIVLRGANVTRGYEDNEAANQNAFSAGWFRTGDRGFVDDDGYLVLSGRIKELINRGGEKISPFEIDKILMEHEEILEAASFPVKHCTLGEDVAVVVVVRDKNQVTEEAIRYYLMKRLAEFKVPSRVFIVDKIPKSATGKVQRGKLAEVFAERLIAEYVAPANELVSKLAAIYAEVLGVERVGANDNFFELGGDSLRATQIISRVQGIFGVNFTVATIFMKATVSELAAEVLAHMNELADDQSDCPVRQQ